MRSLPTAYSPGTAHSILFPNLPSEPLEEISGAQVIQRLVDRDLLPHDRVRLLHSWKHSGFNVHRGEGIPPENKTVLEQLANYFMRHPFPVAKMAFPSGGEKAIYGSKLNPKINRNFETFTGPDKGRKHSAAISGSARRLIESAKADAQCIAGKSV